MWKAITGSFLIGLMGAAIASADLVIDVGTHDFQPGEVRTIALSVAGGDSVVGLNLYIQIGDGGEVNEGVDTVPIMTGVDIIGPGTLFNASNTGQQGGGSPDGLAWIATTTTAGSDVLPAEGVFALVTIDASKTVAGQSYALRLKDVLENVEGLGPISTSFLTSTGGLANLSITDGTLRIVPEPSTLALAFGVLPLLVGFALFRRRR